MPLILPARQGELHRRIVPDAPARCETRRGKITFSPRSRRERGERAFCLAGRYRQIKRFLILRKDKTHDSTTAIKRTEFLLQPVFAEAASGRQVAVSSPSHRLSEPVADRSRRKIFLSDLRGSAVKRVSDWNLHLLAATTKNWLQEALMIC